MIQPRHIFILIAMVSTNAMSQSTPAAQPSLFGERPPVVSVQQAVATGRESTSATEASSAPVEVTDAPVETDGTPSQPSNQSEPPPVLSRSVTSTTRQTENRSAPRNARADIKPAPAEITVNSGQNHVIGVAFSHLNRILTPFPNPVVKTTSLATTSVEGSIVYVATNLPEPIGLFIHDETSPNVAISLTLVPAEIPPISTRVQIRDYTPDAMPVVRSQPSLATAFEQEHTYLDALKAIMRDLATGKVPDGYGLAPLGGHFAGMPECAIPGIHVVPLQLLTGTSLQVVVGKALNTSTSVAEVREDACRGKGLRAVAAWPRTTLQAGEATELYLVIDVPDVADDANARPSVLGGRAL
jgi:conjugal transfer pilus assembly protein TraK